MYFVSGTSLGVQWLRLCPPNAGDLGSFPGQGTRSHVPQPRPGTVKEVNESKIKKNKQTTCIMFLKLARKVDLKRSYHKKETAIMLGNGGVNQLSCGNHLAGRYV